MSILQKTAPNYPASLHCKLQYLALLLQCCVKMMKGLEDQNVVIDTEFSLSALEDVMK